MVVCKKLNGSNYFLPQAKYFFNYFSALLIKPTRLIELIPCFFPIVRLVICKH